MRCFHRVVVETRNQMRMTWVLFRRHSGSCWGHVLENVGIIWGYIGIILAHVGAMLVSFWTTLGSYEDDLSIFSVSFELMLGPCWCQCWQSWDHMKMTWALFRCPLGSCWGHVGVILNSFGIMWGWLGYYFVVICVHFGAMLVSFRTTWESYEDDSDIILVPLGFMLGPCWCHFARP